jgi:hypothetical protein
VELVAVSKEREVRSFRFAPINRPPAIGIDAIERTVKIWDLLIADLRLSLPPIEKCKANQTTLETYKHAVIGLFKPLGKRVPGKQLDSRDWVMEKSVRFQDWRVPVGTPRRPNASQRMWYASRLYL